ncbi:hypothetical protein JT31_13755 [Cedecea neteri]|uniref:PEGA domain-containing protein n=1 Tax=Cedecea neteri TaxID=158822 RepID=A0A089RGM4_9ENTR|nr:hypothetical protein [Cedecea neteri]AIR05640.1 hypothetical protein JT31_13755 [Cedecea neteri]
MKKLLFLLLLPLLTGCATLVSNNDATVYIDSTPKRAAFTIFDGKGEIAAQGITPQSVTLKKTDGSYFGKKNYTLRLKHEGYYSLSLPLETRFSNWYLFGNVIFFGVPGWLIVDPFFGGMYTLKQENLHLLLRACQPGPYRYMCS